MFQLNILGFQSCHIEFFWAHQASVLAGIKSLCAALLQDDWGALLSRAKVLDHLEKISTGIMRLINLAENLPTDKIQFTVDVITEKLVNANQLIQSARAHLENLVDPVVPNAYILGILDDAFMIVLGVQLLEAQKW
jgi:hypothetical protein